MIILAIETSCDDTSVAVLKDQELLSNVVSSQVAFHNKYGGVMPELASRLHVEKNYLCIKRSDRNSKNFTSRCRLYCFYTRTRINWIFTRRNAGS